MSIDSVPALLLLCDKVLESQANELASALRTGTGSIILKTLEDVLEARGSTFSKNLDNNLRKYARAVIVICSENFTKYIDNKDRSNCPKLLKENEDCHKVLKDFFLSERQKVVTKLILVSLNGSESVPAELNGMEIIKKDIETFGVYETFSGQIIAEVMSRM